MRDIKFRGETQDRKWVYGDLIHSGTDTIAILELDTPCLELVTDVVPDTIGQFTGLHDKNGREIYDGDIMKIYDSIAGYVRYNAKYWRYEVAAPKEPIDNERIPSGVPSECWEIIGNIHDNPELLKSCGV